MIGARLRILGASGHRFPAGQEGLFWNHPNGSLAQSLPDICLGSRASPVQIERTHPTASAVLQGFLVYAHLTWMVLLKCLVLPLPVLAGWSSVRSVVSAVHVLLSSNSPGNHLSGLIEILLPP
jgi:hypothetical protein